MEKHNWYRKMSESPGASSAQTGYHARRVHRAFHVRTLKAVKKVVNRDERRLRAENEEISTLSIMLTGGYEQGPRPSIRECFDVQKRTAERESRENQKLKE